MSELDERNLVNELEYQIRDIQPCSLRDPGSGRHQSLDSAGTDLWNLCTKLFRQNQEAETMSPMRTKLIVLARTFSFYVVALARDGDNIEPGAMMLLAKLAIKASRYCIGESRNMWFHLPSRTAADPPSETQELKFAQLLLQSAMDYKTRMEEPSHALPEDELQECTKLESECQILRMVWVGHTIVY